MTRRPEPTLPDPGREEDPYAALRWRVGALFRRVGVISRWAFLFIAPVAVLALLIIYA